MSAPEPSPLHRFREASRLRVECLTHLLDGGEAATQARRRIRGVIQGCEAFSNAGNEHLDRRQRYERGLRKAFRLATLHREKRWSEAEWRIAVEAVADDLPTLLHPIMFVPNLRTLCSAAQQAYWLPKALSGEVCGCYAQTELGHGSNVRALQTTATFCPSDDTFVVHTPSLAATKWWPGSLGRTANTAMVIARLVIRDTDYGVHNFIVPLRDRSSHAVLPGVEVGDIGPKLGYNSMDNGYLRFHSVKVPRLNMAMRYVRVDRKGTYTKLAKAGDDKVAYMTMMQVRALIAGNAGTCIGKAATIAIRYAHVRRQGFTADGVRSKTGSHADYDAPGEHMLLDYPMHQYRLLPRLATSYAFRAVGQGLAASMEALEQHLYDASTPKSAPKDQGDLGLALSQLHATSSGLKALCTREAAEAIEDARKCCGGHGYSAVSGFPELYTTYLQNCTVEGDNFLLPQQVARILAKSFLGMLMGKVRPSGYLDYLNDYRRHIGLLWGVAGRLPRIQGAGQRRWTVAGLLRAYEHRSVRLVIKVARVLGAKGTKQERHDHWLSALVDVDRCARAHCWLVVLRSMQAWVARASSVGDVEKVVLERLTELFGLYHLVEDAGEFLEDSYITGRQLDAARRQLLDAMAFLKSHALSLVDAFDFSDFELKSALGRFDGRVYEALFDSTQGNPLNAPEFVQRIDEIMRLRPRL